MFVDGRFSGKVVQRVHKGPERRTLNIINYIHVFIESLPRFMKIHQITVNVYILEYKSNSIRSPRDLHHMNILYHRGTLRQDFFKLSNQHFKNSLEITPYILFLIIITLKIFQDKITSNNNKKSKNISNNNSVT